MIPILQIKEKRQLCSPALLQQFVPDSVSIERFDSACSRFRARKFWNHMGKSATFLALEAYIHIKGKNKGEY